MMSARPDWLYAVIFFAGASLMAAIEIAGLIICLRRWHLGTAPRLGAIGFGLTLAQTALSQAYQFVQPWFVGTDGTLMMEGIAVFSSAMTLLAGAGTLLVVMALRQALSDFARSRSILRSDE